MLPRTAAAFLFTLSLAVAQDDGARKTGAVFRSDIDALIARLSAAAKVGNDGASWGPLGGDSVVATAQILCAMGHCHRFYHVSDGPLLRASLEQLHGDATAKVVATDAAAAAIVADAKAAGVRELWFQPGAEDPAAIAAARAAGLHVIADGPCLLVALGFRDE